MIEEVWKSRRCGKPDSGSFSAATSEELAAPFASPSRGDTYHTHLATINTSHKWHYGKGTQADKGTML